MTAGDFFSGIPAAAGPLPVEQWQPGHCGDSRMRIARDGTWFHEGTPVGRKELVLLFARLLRRDVDGFVLVTPAEKLSIVVEDAPFLAALLEAQGQGQRQLLTFITNVGDHIVLDAAHRWRIADGVPYIPVRHGLEAKASRAVYYQLAELAVPREGLLGVWSAGLFFALGAAA
jgi:hypothetical protein